LETIFSSVLAESIPGGWRPGIGDPSIGGWVTVAAYFVAAIACWRASVAERRPGQPSRGDHPVFWRKEFDQPSPGATPPSSSDRASSVGRRVLFWRLLLIGMLVLGINKQLDLQSILPVVGRQIARQQGWYESRQAVQHAFITGVAISGIAALSIFAFLFRSAALRRPLAPVGLIFLFSFVLIRASSFHHVDVLLGEAILGVRVNHLLELGGISLVVLAALQCVVDGRSARGGEPRTTRD
jgi:hypothetical protein